MHSSLQLWEVAAELNASPGGLHENPGGYSGWRWGEEGAAAGREVG